jgi:hypothetical protein
MRPGSERGNLIVTNDWRQASGLRSGSLAGCPPWPMFCRAWRDSGGWRSAPANGYRTAPRWGGLGFPEVAGGDGRRRAPRFQERPPP